MRLQLSAAVVYIDPYLTDYVADTFGGELARLVPPPVAPHDVGDATWVLVTHAHADHADPTTLAPLAKASPGCRFICPSPVVPILIDAGIDKSRIRLASEQWSEMAPSLSVRAVPAAHTGIERDADGNLSYVGYLLRHQGKSIYHSGDTIPHPEIFEALKRDQPIDVAMLPVNERNYYRDAAGIVGNMSVREACQMATDVAARILVPIHWDLFAPNGTPRAEIELIYGQSVRPFELKMIESGATLALW